MRFAALTVPLLGLAIVNSLAAAEPATKHETTVRVDESSRGDLAFGRGPNGPWTVARRGEFLPPDVFLRTSALNRPCRLQIGRSESPGGILQLGPETQARLVAGERKVVVTTGRVFLDSMPGWSVFAGSLQATLSIDSSAEMELGADGRISAKVMAGEIEVAGEGVEPSVVRVRHGLVRKSPAAKPELVEFTTSELERLWASAEASPPHGLGQLVVQDLQSGSAVRLNLARYHVNVVLHPPVALVQIDQSFYNPYPRVQEGTFVFNLPEGASVSRFAMYTTPQQLVEGELIERTRAANIYQSIVNRQRDPAILEQIGGNLFRMRVYPIAARDAKRILLDYTVPITEQEEGWQAFELPLISDLEPVWDFAITGAIRGPNVAGTARSASHSAVRFFDSDDGAIRFAFRERSYRPESAFGLRFQQRPAAAVTVRSFVPAASQKPNAEKPKAEKLTGAKPEEASAQNDEKKEPDDPQPEPQCAFLATIGAAVLEPSGKARRAAPLPVDVLILADTSGGMTDRAPLRQVVQTIATSLRTGDRFRLGCVDTGFRSLTKDWLAPQTPEAAQAMARFDREFLLGASDFIASFDSALKSLPAIEKGRRRIVVYVGDGVLPEDRAEAAAAGKEVFEKESQRLAATLAQADARFCAVLSENDPAGRKLMEKLASATGGRLFRSAAGASSELFDWLLSGCPAPARIISVKAHGVADEDLFVPSAWLPGRALQIFGRRKEPGTMKLEITFESEGKITSRDWALTLKNDPDDLFVGRLWAQHKLDQLRGTHDREAGKRVVALSQEWTLLSPLTAFLVLEDEAEYPKYGITRSLRHQYWKPADAVASEPLPPDALEALKAAPRIGRETTHAQFYHILAAAKKALRGSASARALNLLDGVADSPLADRSQEFKTLHDSAVAFRSRGDLLRELGPQRGWFDRRKAIGFENATHDLLWQMLYGYGSAGRYDDPRLAALAKLVTPPKEGITLEDFAGWIRDASGLDVWLDEARLTDEGVDLTQEPSLRGIRSMSIENLMRHVLGRSQLTWVFEDDVLKITTSARAGEKLTNRLYPVTDLIQTTRSTDYALLVNSDLDRELLSNRRLNEKLNRKITVEFDDAPLEDVFDFLCDKLDENVVLDRPTLTDEGVALDQPVSLKLKNIPVRSLLAQLCEPLQLKFSVENEAIVITTAAMHGEKLQVRLHSGEGIVYELPPELVRQRGPRAIGNGMAGMGGFGGGMGGMQNGMGGLIGGAMGAGMGGGAAAPGYAVVSQSSADGDVPKSGVPISDRAPPADSDPDSEMDPNEAPTVINPVEKFNTLARRRSTTTAYETIELIEQTIQPDTWEGLSGPGTIIYFPAALGFAVRQTQDIHEEIEELLDRLREIPPAFGKETGMAPAKIPHVGPSDIDNWEMNTLMNLIKTVIEPDAWEDLSGPGVMQMYAPKLVLSVHQTQDVHRQIGNLLTVLRRARYLARQGRKWKSFGLAEGPWFTGVLGLTDIPPGTRQSELPEPDADEIAALAALGEPLLGQQTWRSIPSDGRAPQTTIIRQSRARTEFEFDGRVARVEADEAMVAYPGITIVERGPWGEALRRMVDGRLPWLPHRTRRELARLFKITIEGQDEESLCVRFELPGAPAGNDLRVTISRQHGLPTRWESRLGGKPAVRLRFEDLSAAAASPIWKTVIAEDDSGAEIERWELVKFEELESQIPPLDAGWKDFVVLDLRAQERVSLPAVIRVLKGVRLRDWPAADQALAAALESQPDQPFLLLVKAWSLAQRQGSHEEEVVPLLKRVGRLGTAELLQPLVDRSFVPLGDDAVYEILLAQPLARRRDADWDVLARVAARVGKPRDAIGHLEAAIAQAGPAGDDPARPLLLIRLLFETRQDAQAVAVAKARALRPNVHPEELADLAETLHQWGAVSEAATLMRQALAAKHVTGERRYHLLRRRAGLESGPARWQTLLEAIDAIPRSAALRSEGIEAILNDLTDPAQGDAAARLGDEAKDKAVQAALRLRRAELFALRSNAGAAADIGWNLYESKRLPAARTNWLFSRLIAARQHARVIQLVEERLRAGDRLNQKQLESLAVAYDAAGRPDDAHRARTNVSDLPPRRGLQ